MWRWVAVPGPNREGLRLVRSRRGVVDRADEARLSGP